MLKDREISVASETLHLNKRHVKYFNCTSCQKC